MRYKKFETPDQMRDAVERYFDDCAAREVSPTMSGLALAIGFKNRVSLHEYKKRDDGFAEIILNARARVEQSLEESLVSGRQAAGIIFNLKNNFGWRDKTEQTLNHNVMPGWIDGLPDDDETQTSEK